MSERERETKTMLARARRVHGLQWWISCRRSAFAGPMGMFHGRLIVE
jgi:hypothetical protein